LGVLCAAAFAAAADGNHHYFYFKERRELLLDSTRIAIQTTDTQIAASKQVDALRAVGIEPADLAQGPIRGWSFAATPPARRTAAELAQAITALAAADVGFISPVFVGEDGGPIVVLPDVLLQFEPGVDSQRRRAILSETGLAILDENWANMPRAYRLRGVGRNGLEVLAAANQLAMRPEIRFAEPDVLFTGRGGYIPNDTFFPDQWEHENTGQLGGMPDIDMDTPEAWDVTTGDSSIIVVVIDVGVEQAHPDINQLPGHDVTGEGGGGGPVNMCDNHGTPVAGCVSAIIDNGIGVAGAAPSCRAASVRTFISNFSCDGMWSSEASWTVEALTWAESIGARVTNNSNFYGFSSGAIATKYADTRASGMVHFASAGNGNAPFVTYPASLPSVMAIGAIDRFGNKAPFSNFGTNIDYTAPGDDVVTTDRTGADGWSGDDYAVVDGTSFASPYTAGVAALILSLRPGLTASAVESVLRITSVDLGAFGKDTIYGWGVVNALDAVSFDPCSIDAVTPEASPIEKNRYISFIPDDAEVSTAIRVELVELMRPSPPNLDCCPAPDFSAFEGQYRWVGPLQTCPDSVSQNSTFRCAVLQCTPHYQAWDPAGIGLVIHVTGSEITPSSLYRLQAVADGCDAEPGNFTTPLELRTGRWGDVASPYQDRGSPFPAMQPNAMDIAAVVDKVKDTVSAVSKPRVQLQGNAPNPHGQVNALDIGAAVSAVKSAPYSFAGPVACP
jgi:subtilisin family serine protease